MRKSAASLVAAAVTAGAILAATLPASAQPSARTATPAQQTCSAFTAWDQHKTAARLDRLVTVSLALPHGYLAADTGQLLADSVTAKPKAKYIRSDEKWISEDCAKVQA